MMISHLFRDDVDDFLDDARQHFRDKEANPSTLRLFQAQQQTEVPPSFFARFLACSTPPFALTGYTPPFVLRASTPTSFFL